MQLQKFPLKRYSNSSHSWHLKVSYSTVNCNHSLIKAMREPQSNTRHYVSLSQSQAQSWVFHRSILSQKWAKKSQIWLTEAQIKFNRCFTRIRKIIDKSDRLARDLRKTYSNQSLRASQVIWNLADPLVTTQCSWKATVRTVSWEKWVKKMVWHAKCQSKSLNKATNLEAQLKNS